MAALLIFIITIFYANNFISFAARARINREISIRRIASERRGHKIQCCGIGYVISILFNVSMRAARIVTSFSIRLMNVRKKHTKRVLINALWRETRAKNTWSRRLHWCLATDEYHFAHICSQDYSWIIIPHIVAHWNGWRQIKLPFFVLRLKSVLHLRNLLLHSQRMHSNGNHPHTADNLTHSPKWYACDEFNIWIKCYAAPTWLPKTHSPTAIKAVKKLHF